MSSISQECGANAITNAYANANANANANTNANANANAQQMQKNHMQQKKKKVHKKRERPSTGPLQAIDKPNLDEQERRIKPLNNPDDPGS